VLYDDVAILRKKRLDAGKPAVPDSLQGVSKAHVKQVLGKLALGDKPDIVDAVFALGPGLRFDLTCRELARAYHIFQFFADCDCSLPGHRTRQTSSGVFGRNDFYDFFRAVFSHPCEMAILSHPESKFSEIFLLLRCGKD
jgi:hypothetical protein